jgi:hypothetical protein
MDQKKETDKPVVKDLAPKKDAKGGVGRSPDSANPNIGGPKRNLDSTGNLDSGNPGNLDRSMLS